MIRKMQSLDMPIVLDIWLAGNLQAHPFISAAYWQSQLEKMEREYLPAAEVFVYEDEEDHRVKGFMGIAEGSYIAGLFVYPHAQGQGIGRQLLAYGQELYPLLTLHVYCENKRAIRFYEQNGFQVTAYGIDKATGVKEQEMVWSK